jgi:1-acyl-sn-glycerol-3-phosphate acyltransferase
MEGGPVKISTEQVSKMLDHFPKNVGPYGYDPWGFNIKSIEPFTAIGKFLVEDFFRVEAYGLKNIPPKGRLLIIPNHTGQLPIDAMILGYVLVTNPHAPRAAKGMMERLIPKLPIISSWFSQMGGVVGDPVNCQRMLESEETIMVFPEGARGISKPFKRRYQLESFGSGFMRLAMDHRTPIVPVGIVGFEEAIIQLGNIKPLAKAMGIPVFPLILPMVLPSKVIIHFGNPMMFEGENATEAQVRHNVEIVEDEIRRLIKMGLEKRKGIFSK